MEICTFAQSDIYQEIYTTTTKGLARARARARVRARTSVYKFVRSCM